MQALEEVPGHDQDPNPYLKRMDSFLFRFVGFFKDKILVSPFPGRWIKVVE